MFTSKLYCGTTISASNKSLYFPGDVGDIFLDILLKTHNKTQDWQVKITDGRPIQLASSRVVMSAAVSMPQTVLRNTGYETVNA